MKTTLVRSFVILLALTGMGASAVSAHVVAKKGALARVSIVPVPMCPPSDPHYCGMQ